MAASSRGLGLLNLALLLNCLSHLFFNLDRSTFVVPRGPRSPSSKSLSSQRRGVQLRAAAEESSSASNEKLLGAWRYSRGAYYIKQDGDKLYFQEQTLMGELKSEGEWFVASLAPQGTIRLKFDDTGSQLLSNFKQANSDSWGEDIFAVREWATIASRANALEEALLQMRFEGSEADGDVVVTVDGKQRPVDVKISDKAASLDSSKLSELVVDANKKASHESLGVMSEKLREMYAGHFNFQNAR
eukprot:TRINITY_DN20303_c0_g1_i1.p1 TRINITY_DN20303_c0_g1~~TRINITY_DN20303_c0_g1_i1.p1  ORF type:complete len:263 (-),score=62.45 TRINITY_DN20303_c0_g1_i1:26-757(-)